MCEEKKRLTEEENLMLTLKRMIKELESKKIQDKKYIQIIKYKNNEYKFILTNNNTYFESSKKYGYYNIDIKQ